MKTRRIFGLMLTAALMGGLSMGAVSCKSDEDTVENETISTLTVESGLIANGVNAEMKSAVVELPVKCDGQWFALLGYGQSDTPDWVHIQKWQPTYNGNQTLLIAFDQNLTGYDRKTTLTLANSAGKTIQVPITQTYTLDGKAPDNSSGQVFSNKGVGYGMDYNYLLDMKSTRYRGVQEQLKINSGQMRESEATKFNALAVAGINNLFNISQIEKLMVKDASGQSELQASAYVETPIELADLTLQMLDSCLKQDEHLNVSLKIDLSLGPITFNARAAYNSTKKEESVYIDYNMIRNAPMYDVRLSPAEISTYAALSKNRLYDIQEINDFRASVLSQMNLFQQINEWTYVPESELNKNGLTEEQQNIIDGMYRNIDTGYDFGGVYSTAFAKAYSRLLRAITLNVKAKNPLPINETLATQVCQQLNDYYGPFIICRAQFGGALILSARVDTLRLDGFASASGSLEAAAGPFSAEGAFEYSETGFDLMRNIGAKFSIMGGTANDTTDELSALMASDKPDCREEWFTAMNGWWKSMKSDSGESHAEPISYSVVPIWTLFTEPEISEYVRKWFLDKYQDRGIYEYLDIMSEKPEAKTATDILSQKYDFDLKLAATGIPVTGDMAHPLTVAEVRSTANALNADRLKDAVFFVKGKVCAVDSPYDAGTGVATFAIADPVEVGPFDVAVPLYCNKCSYIGNKPWKAGDAQIAVGDEVIVYGKYDKVTQAFIENNCALYKHNDKVAE